MIIDRRAFLASTAAVAVSAQVFARLPVRGLAPVDTTIRPGQDFYRFANGPWLATATIPPDKTGWDEFTRLADLNAKRVRSILEHAAGTRATGTEAKFGRLYASLNDNPGREAAGVRPVQPDLAAIAAIADPAGISAALGGLTRDVLRDPQSSRYPGPVAALVYPDVRQPTRVLATLAQGGIGLPDRDVYFADKPAAAAMRDAYRLYLKTLFQLVGDADPAKSAADAYGLEERIAKAHRPLIETFDLEKRYNLWTIANLRDRAPGMDWPVFLKTIGFPADGPFLVADPDAIVAVAVAVRNQPIAIWRAYLMAQRLAAFAPYGPTSLVAAHFAYTGGALLGVPQPPPVWRQSADTVDRAMGPAVGAVYLQRHFPAAARAAAVSLAADIKTAMGKRIAALTWMTPATKARALAKLAAVRVDVGGEEKPRNYSALQIQAQEPWANVVACARHNFDEAVASIGRPLDRGIWQMLPQTVNAQSNPILNKIMFPAGIMQPPLFDPTADPAVNFGAIGMFIGHELSHLFDNIGAIFDEQGRLANWWQPADKQHFTTATSALALQYDAYQPFPDLHLKGRQTLHENVADLAGLAVAFDAYKASTRGRPAPLIDGRTGEQRFFLSFAQLWREQLREPALRQMIAIGTHSHGEWRVATVRNLDIWYTAFDVRPTDALYLPPDQRVTIW